MKSFSLIRTNVALTTNLKIIVSGNYSLSLESIESDPALSSSKYKNFKFNKNSYYDEVVPAFYDGLPSIIAYKVRDNDDKDIVIDNFENQYDDIYQAGCRNISNNKAYFEEFECFAPLYIGNELPKNFIIFRIDGPGLINLNRFNFTSEIVDKLKCVKVFNLTKATPLGEWLNSNFVDNKYKPDYPLYIDFRNLEFSSWKGIDYEVGGWISKNVFLESTLEYENTFYDLEKTITNGFRENGVIFPNILNLSFLFDDTPATPDSLRKWSINRYMGFYIDEMNLFTSYTPYILETLRSDIIVRPGNIIFSQSEENPFVGEWLDERNTYVEIGGAYFKVERYFRETSPSETKIQLSNDVYSDEVVRGRKFFYKIISDKEFTGLTYSSINSNTIEVSSDDNGYYIEKTNADDLIPVWNTADVWLIKINDLYHKINKIGSKYYLNSDYGFELTSTSFKYFINRDNNSFTTNIPLDINNPTLKFSIYRLKFSDIKDFDTTIVDTQFSRYEYEKELTLSDTNQPKFYSTDLSVSSIPKPFNEYYVENKLTNIPCSSEYTANGELFRLVDNDLSDIWNKNPLRVKWAFDSSLSANDYPYRLNNSFIADDFNQTVNPFSTLVRRWDRNLDYFYTVNSSTSSYVWHSLHIESFTSSYELDSNFEFKLDQYLTINTDYFSWFFGKTSSFLNGSNIVSTKKWSKFQKGDKVTPNLTLFRGIRFDIQDVLDVKLSSGAIQSINLTNQNRFDDWKFSIITSKNNYRVTASESNSEIGYLEQTNNQMTWYQLNNWRYSFTYSVNDIVLYQNIIWQSLQDHSSNDPSKNPSNSQNWYYHSTSGPFSSSYSVFWQPLKTYNDNDWVYYGGDYYYYEPKGTSYSFWNPKKTYTIDDYTIYNRKIWISTTSSNFYQPDSSTLKSDFVTSENAFYWKELKDGTNPTDWQLIEIWSSNYIYSTNSITKNLNKTVLPGEPYCIWKNVLYQLASATASFDPPDISASWIRKYSFEQDTDYVYSIVDNPIIKMNNTHYICLSNNNSDTLENGICIYIHKKWKNVLINLFINDNTLGNLSNADRDTIYNDLYTNLTAANFIAALSDLSKKYGFSDYLKYVIINEDGSLNTYDYNNISSLPYMIIPQFPDGLYSRYDSLSRKPVSLNENQIKAQRVLYRRRIETIDMLNYYNGNDLATIIDKVQLDKQIIANYHGLENNVFNVMWRFSGNYSPLVYDIPLFQRDLVSATNSGNYKFDTSITDFGMMKERIWSKVNRTGSVLKLKTNKDLKSIYPMIDEFGYHYNDFFIFKSTWDQEFHVECLQLEQSDIPILLTNKTIKFE